MIWLRSLILGFAIGITVVAISTETYNIMGYSSFALALFMATFLFFD